MSKCLCWRVDIYLTQASVIWEGISLNKKMTTPGWLLGKPTEHFLDDWCGRVQLTVSSAISGLGGPGCYKKAGWESHGEQVSKLVRQGLASVSALHLLGCCFEFLPQITWMMDFCHGVYCAIKTPTETDILNSWTIIDLTKCTTLIFILLLPPYWG